MSYYGSCPAFAANDAGNLFSWCNHGLICPTPGSPSSSKAVAVHLAIPHSFFLYPVWCLPFLRLLACRNNQWHLEIKQNGALECVSVCSFSSCKWYMAVTLKKCFGMLSSIYLYQLYISQFLLTRCWVTSLPWNLTCLILAQLGPLLNENSSFPQILSPTAFYFS